MSKKLSIDDELDSAAELFILVSCCAKDEESHLLLHNDPDAEPSTAKPKLKAAKRKGPAELACPRHARCE